MCFGAARRRAGVDLPCGAFALMGFPCGLLGALGAWLADGVRGRCSLGMRGVTRALREGRAKGRIDKGVALCIVKHSTIWLGDARLHLVYRLCTHLSRIDFEERGRADVLSASTASASTYSFRASSARVTTSRYCFRLERAPRHQALWSRHATAESLPQHPHKHYLNSTPRRSTSSVLSLSCISFVSSFVSVRSRLR